MAQKNTEELGIGSLDLLTRGRRNKTKPINFTEQKRGVGRTVGRVPEVMVKVSGGGKSVKQVYNHLTYIVRNGDLEAITEGGERLSNRDELRALLDEWDLESSRGYGRAKLTFNLVLSMPKGTDPQKLHESVRKFARDQFWDQHQYVMVLHEDRDHPHVHICVKAMSKDDKHRLYIRKDTLEMWRQEFAKDLRQHGIAANATPRDLRGTTRKSKSIGLFYAEKAGRSRVLEAKVREIAENIYKGGQGVSPWTLVLEKRRAAVLSLYHNAANELRKTGDHELANDVDTFASSLPPIVTERDLMVKQITRLLHKQPHGKVAHAQPSEGRGGEGVAETKELDKTQELPPAGSKSSARKRKDRER